MKVPKLRSDAEEYFIEELGIAPENIHTDKTGKITINQALKFRAAGFFKTKLAYKFHHLIGSIDCRGSSITSMENFPDGVDGDLVMRGSPLENLDFCPKIVTGFVMLSKTAISSLRGLPAVIGDDLLVKECAQLTDFYEYRYALLSKIRKACTTDSVELDTILNSGRVNGDIPSELIPGKIRQLKELSK